MKRAPVFNHTDVIMLLGKRGSGKTTLGRKLQKCYPRLVIFDRLHEYQAENSKDTWTVETFDDFAEAIKATLGRPKFKIIFHFDIEATNHDDVFNEALRVLYFRGDLCLVIEEIHNFANPHFLPHWLREALLTGRHRRLALIGTSQRPAEVHKTLLSQCHHIFCGNLHEKNDVSYLSTVMGEAALKLATLRQFHFLHFQPGMHPKIVKS